MEKVYRFITRHKMTEDNQGYGGLKQWYWGMRSDICDGVASMVTTGVPYITPFTQDTVMAFKPEGMRFKFTYQMIDPFGTSNWTMTLKLGIYKMLKGTGGTSGTLELLPSQLTYSWAGKGSARPTTVYDGSTSLSVTALNINPITDGALYLVMLWNVNWSGIGPISLITCSGNNVSSGTWLYGTSGLTSQTSLPQTIAALGGAA